MKRPVAERFADCLLHRFVGDVQLADAIPLRGVLAKILLSRFGARLANGGEPLAITRDDAVVRVEPRGERAGEFGAAAAFGEPKERPGAFAETLDQPSLHHQLEMARDARLRLPEDVGEIGDRQFGLADEGKDAQARLLARGFEGRVEGVKWQVGWTVDQGIRPII